MQAATQHVGQQALQQGAARVVVDVGYHGLPVELVETHGVVVVVVEQGGAACGLQGRSTPGAASSRGRE